MTKVRKVFLKTYGCQMNDYDSARILDLLEAAHGFESTQNQEEADLLLLNTCSIRAKAEAKVYSELGRWRALKEKNKGVVIGVGGCVASQEGAAIQKRAPYVDVVFGPQTIHRLPALLDAAARRRAPQMDVRFPEMEKFDRLPKARADGVSAFVSIMEGCSKYCTFCVVPYTRGEERSRPLASVLAEIATLAGQGVREVTLLGQNVNGYRYWENDAEGGAFVDFSLLLHHVAAIDGIDRIRFTTSHPVDFNDELIAAYAELPQLADHLHLPVQSGSDRVLAAMKRGYTVLEYKSIVRKLKKVRPRLSLSSDFIVGFPGESDDDFAHTMALIEDTGYDQSFSFLYSPRPGTPAAALPDDTPQAVKKHRLAILQRRVTELANAVSESMIGGVEQVLVGAVSKKNRAQLCGRTSNNRVVNFDGERSLIGAFADVEIIEALPNSLRGRLV